MQHFLRKSHLLIFIVLLLALFALAWLFPAAGPRLGMVFLVVSLLMASFFIVREQRTAYWQGRIPRGTFMRNVTVEVAAVGLAMVLAGLLGRALGAPVTEQIGDAVVRLLVAILIGLIAGLTVGLLFNWILEGRLVNKGM